MVSSIDRSRDDERKEGAAVWLAVGSIERHELLMSLAEIEFDCPETMGTFDFRQVGCWLAVSVGDRSAPPDIVHVVGEALAVHQIEVLVVVLGDQPVPRTLASVIFAVSRLHIDREVVPGCFQGELDETTWTSGSVIDRPDVTPNIEVVPDPIPSLP
jgi:hypothetical protein